MKPILDKYASYNLWANDLLLKAVLKCTDEESRKPVISSFNSVYATLLHLWDAESIWWQRIKLSDVLEVPSSKFSGTVSEMTIELLAQSELWKQWVLKSTDAALRHEIIYRNTKKEQFKQSVADILMHLFNHQSYHRGQLITLLRQAGQTSMPSTDFIQFLRKK